VPKMIERLFMVQEINEHGFYRVKLNKVFKNDLLEWRMDINHFR
jgi:hypothetical protein